MAAYDLNVRNPGQVSVPNEDYSGSLAKFISLGLNAAKQELDAKNAQEALALNQRRQAHLEGIPEQERLAQIAKNQSILNAQNAAQQSIKDQFSVLGGGIREKIAGMPEFAHLNDADREAMFAELEDAGDQNYGRLAPADLIRNAYRSSLSDTNLTQEEIGNLIQGRMNEYRPTLSEDFAGQLLRAGSGGQGLNLGSYIGGRSGSAGSAEDKQVKTFSDLYNAFSERNPNIEEDRRIFMPDIFDEDVNTDKVKDLIAFAQKKNATPSGALHAVEMLIRDGGDTFKSGVGMESLMNPTTPEQEQIQKEFLALARGNGGVSSREGLMSQAITAQQNQIAAQQKHVNDVMRGMRVNNPTQAQTIEYLMGIIPDKYKRKVAAEANKENSTPDKVEDELRKSLIKAQKEAAEKSKQRIAKAEKEIPRLDSIPISTGNPIFDEIIRSSPVKGTAADPIINQPPVNTGNPLFDDLIQRSR